MRLTAFIMTLVFASSIMAIATGVLYIKYLMHEDDVVCRSGHVVVIKPGIEVDQAMKGCGRDG
jgi:hypothetical protein